MAPHGQNLDSYDPKQQARILATRRRFDGKKGDIVIFDDRGFHGPDQPSPKKRLVMLLDWMRNESWGGPVQAAAFRVLTSDLGRLSPKQLRVLGVGATPLGPRETYHLHSFGRQKTFGRQKIGRWAHDISCWLIDHAFVATHLKRTVRARLGRIWSHRQH